MCNYYIYNEPYNRDPFEWNNMHRNDFNKMRHFAAEENKKAVEKYEMFLGKRYPSGIKAENTKQPP